MEEIHSSDCTGFVSAATLANSFAVVVVSADVVVVAAADCSGGCNCGAAAASILIRG